ncbi:hypothetical protein [Ruminococcus difficilis]|uniref:Uncharacterized protein n=1 Tax=Ruminococcus difficilis TaxID=2763069 RepID=A0A934TYN4_9FIRM|nr:hypothetical protein [Ruminococcus difficilis]MBK6087163.1 hypothetical protein [Ruminococcus difficilis]
MAKYFDKDEIKESSSEKKIRIFLAVMYFLLVLTEVWMPLMYGPVNDEGQYSILTAVNLLIQPNGYGSAGQVMSAIYGAILVILPIVSFFFFLLDKKSKKKYVISYITCILSAVVICFGPGSSIAYGGIISLILILVIMFMTTQGFQATRMRERADAEEKTE